VIFLSRCLLRGYFGFLIKKVNVIHMYMLRHPVQLTLEIDSMNLVLKSRQFNNSIVMVGRLDGGEFAVNLI